MRVQDSRNKPKNIIEVLGLTRKFGDKIAVKNLNLEIKEAEIYGFLGPNGAGKSTTIKMLVTLLDYDSGQVNILGHDLQKESSLIRLKIGAALQEAALDNSQTGIEFLETQARLYGLNRQQSKARIESLLPLVGIGNSIYKQIKTYSGGMKRRLDLAGSIIHNPKILFLDEPTTGLDPISRNKVWKEVKRLNKDLGMTIFLTTQYLEEADQLADRIGIISHGELKIQGTPEELKNTLGEDLILIKTSKPGEGSIKKLKQIKGIDKVEYINDQLVLACSNGSKVLETVIIKLKDLGIKIHSLNLRTTTLDDVFLKVTGDRLQEG